LEEEGRAEQRLARWESAGALLWFAMDSSWMASFSLAAQLLIIPALYANLGVLAFCRERSDRLVTLATVSWLTMNIAWMLGELHERAELQLWARAFCLIGFACLAAVWLTDSRGPDALLERLRRFRRLRAPQD
jgi:hypothetical protein